MREGAKIKVVLDTDIGGDIDDTWALAFLLKCPELDLKLVSTATQDTVYRAKVAAKLLEIAGRTDVPIAVGEVEKGKPHHCPQAPWVEGYELASYPGKVRMDGAAFLAETIMALRPPVSLVVIGPAPNIKAALDLEPRIAQRCRFIGMHGSIAKHHDGGAGAIEEYNVAQDVPAFKAVLAAPWKEMVLTPLDTCGQVRLKGAKYEAVKRAGEPLTRAVIENYRIWSSANPGEFERRSSILFDTVAVYLAFSREFLKMEKMKLGVKDSGLMVQDGSGPNADVAMDWRDLGAFEDLLVKRLAG